MSSDPITDKLNVLCGAASKVVADVFNCRDEESLGERHVPGGCRG